MGAKMKSIVLAAVALAVSVTAFPLIFTGVAGISNYAQQAIFTGLNSIRLSSVANFTGFHDL